MRSHVCWYLKGEKNSSEVKKEVNEVITLIDLEKYFNKISSTGGKNKMALIMDGKLVSRIIESELKEELIKMKLIDNQRPTLATIIVGNDPSSVTYVKMKVNACKRVGFKSIKIALMKK